MCKESSELIYHHFLHCPLALGLWLRLFSLAMGNTMYNGRDDDHFL